MYVLSVCSIWEFLCVLIKTIFCLTPLVYTFICFKYFSLRFPVILLLNYIMFLLVNLAWYHHFTHIACAKKLRGLRQKLDALRVQTGPSLSKYQGFGRKLKCYKDISFFFNRFELQSVGVFIMMHPKKYPQISSSSDFICYFSCI